MGVFVFEKPPFLCAIASNRIRTHPIGSKWLQLVAIGSKNSRCHRCFVMFLSFLSPLPPLSLFVPLFLPLILPLIISLYLSFFLPQLYPLIYLFLCAYKFAYARFFLFLKDSISQEIIAQNKGTSATNWAFCLHTSVWHFLTDFLSTRI